MEEGAAVEVARKGYWRNTAKEADTLLCKVMTPIPDTQALKESPVFPQLLDSRLHQYWSPLAPRRAKIAL